MSLAACGSAGSDDKKESDGGSKGGYKIGLTNSFNGNSYRQQMEAYLDGDYETDIEIYLRSQQNMIELADFLTSGLLAR